MATKGANYLGGFSWAPDPGWGELSFYDDRIELYHPLNRHVIVKVGVPVITTVEVASEQVAKSRLGNTLFFGILGAVSTKHSEDRASFLVNISNGQTGYFSMIGFSEEMVLAKVSPWLRSVGIPIRKVGSDSALSRSSIADELAKLATLKEAGVITDAEFAAQKAKLLG